MFNIILLTACLAELNDILGNLANDLTDIRWFGQDAKWGEERFMWVQSGVSRGMSDWRFLYEVQLQLLSATIAGHTFLTHWIYLFYSFNFLTGLLFNVILSFLSPFHFLFPRIVSFFFISKEIYLYKAPMQPECQNRSHYRGWELLSIYPWILVSDSSLAFQWPANSGCSWESEWTRSGTCFNDESSRLPVRRMDLKFNS